MKVVHISTYDTAGGAARAAYRLHRGLRGGGADSRMLVRYKRSHDPFVATAAPGPASKEEEQAFFCQAALQDQAVNSNRTEISNTLFSISYPGYDLSAASLMREADVIHLHWIAYYQSPVTIKSLLDLGKPVVWTLHDQWAFTGGCHYSAGCSGYERGCEACPQLREDPFGLAAALLSDKKELFSGGHLTIVTPSRWLAECARSSVVFKGRRVEVIPNGIETDIFCPMPKPQAKEALGLDPGILTLLFGAENTGEKRKGFKQLAEVLRHCMADERFRRLVQGDRLRLLCFGYPSPVIEEAGIPVTSLGYLNSDEKVRTAYSAADIFIQASLEDNLPNTMLEAMACGTPVVAFGVGGMPDVIEHGVTGMLAPAGDAERLGDAILETVFDRRRLEEMAERCRGLMETRFSLHNQGNAFLAIYEELVSKGVTQRDYSLGNSYGLAVSATEVPESSVALMSINLGSKYLEVTNRIIPFNLMGLAMSLESKITDIEESYRGIKALIQSRELELYEVKTDREKAVEEIRIRDKKLEDLKADRERAVAEIEIRDEKLVGLRADREKAVEEIRRRDQLLETLRKDREIAIEEIRKRDEAYALLLQDRNNAVSEIHIRDDNLLQLLADRNKAVEEIHKRDDALAQLKNDYLSVLGLSEQQQKEFASLSVRHNRAISALPLVSIVTPVYNCARWVENCIKSVLDQDYPRIEHIIVDGGSDDGTIEICQKYPHLIMHSKKDRGQSHAINKGFSMAQGDILAWLCADDEYVPGAVKAAVRSIMKGHSVVMGKSQFIDAEGNLICDHPSNNHQFYDRAMLLRFWKYNPISQPATFWTRRIWEICGPLRENLYFAMDYDLWLRMSAQATFIMMANYTAKYRIHPDAKCFADNYGSKRELIKVSRHYWPAPWSVEFWNLVMGYLFTSSAITKHYDDGNRLLTATAANLHRKKGLAAMLSFIKAHMVHPAMPSLPGYKPVLKELLVQTVAPRWAWRAGRRAWRGLRSKST